MESPLRLTAHGGFGEGDGETRLSKGRKVRPVPTPRSGGRGREAPPYRNLGAPGSSGVTPEHLAECRYDQDRDCCKDDIQDRRNIVLRKTKVG